MLCLEATTRAEFHTAIGDVSQAVLAAGGWVVTHQFFARARAVLTCEIPGTALGRMAAALAAVGISVDPPADGWPDTDRDIRVNLALCFTGDGADFRREVPAFG